MKNYKSRHSVAKAEGFTLIELLVVVLIIGILAAIALPQYTKAVEKSRAAESIQMVGSLKKALNIHFLENNTCNVNIKDLVLEVPYTGSKSDSEITTKNYSYFIDGGTCMVISCSMNRAQEYCIYAMPDDYSTQSGKGKPNAEYFDGALVCQAYKDKPDAMKDCRAIAGTEPKDCPWTSTRNCYKIH
ncbi:prepilin-type N-terminal cleavage/methylation domain-containing protein [Elusimicrobium posterum]|uniref:type IV pilin protein n=1 Tax=Elusimicrobium posterum TaxID=3116653 RepID=UPI003C790DDF